MPTSPPYVRARSAPTRQEQNREADERRGSARSRGYDRRWQKARLTFLSHRPLCEFHALAGDVEPATLVDHLYPHRQYDGVFWRTEWWVASCKACHDGLKQRVEAAGKPALDDLARRLGRPVLAGEGVGRSLGPRA
jgi:5-methylcytosine-specific restriction endonuclease McrA